MNYPTPLDYRNLAWSKKIQILVVMYLSKCHRGEKQSKSTFFAIRGCFIKDELTQIHTLYDYLFQLDYGVTLTLTEFYKNANAYCQQQMIAKPSETQYEEFKMEDLDNL